VIALQKFRNLLPISCQLLSLQIASHAVLLSKASSC
jgi:hypothetical protein